LRLQSCVYRADKFGVLQRMGQIHGSG
jgi:hypothetical protein